MDTATKNRILELEKEVDELEAEIVKRSNSSQRLGTLKSEQWAKINEIKKLKSRFDIGA